MGFGRTARILEHASSRLQRCRRHLFHVRSFQKIYFAECERVVQTGTRSKQGKWTSMCFSFRMLNKTLMIPLTLLLYTLLHLLQTAQAFLVGTKFDMFTTLPPEEIDEIDKLARKYAKAMKAPLVFSSASHSINVQKMFKIVLSKVFDLKCTVAEIVEVGEPLLIF